MNPALATNPNQYARRHAHQVAGWLSLCLFAVFLFNYSGRVTAADEISMLLVARNLVTRHSFDATSQIWEYQVGISPAQESFGVDGELYSKKGPGQPLLLAGLMLPAYLLPVPLPVQLGLLLNVFVTTLEALAVFALVQLLSGKVNLAVVGALMFALATPALPYAKTLFNEPLTGLCLAAAMIGIVWWEWERSMRPMLLAGVPLAFAVSVRLETVLFAALIGLYVFVVWLRDPARRLADLIAFGAPLFIGALALAAYNIATGGFIFSTMYQLGSEAESFSTPVWEGLFGLLLSPGKGLIFYTPVVIFAVTGFGRLWAQKRALAVLIGALLLSYTSLHAAFHDWWGGTAWGPRPLVPLLPLLVLLAVLGAESILRSRAGRWTFAILFAISLVIALFGTMVNYTAYAAELSQIRPDAEWTIGVYDPAYSPIVGHLRLLQQTTPDFAWFANDTVDWPMVVSLVALNLLIGLALWRSLHHGFLSPRGLALAGALCVCAAAFLVARVYAAAMPEDGAAWRDAAAMIDGMVYPRDILLNTTPVGRLALLYYDRSPGRWLNFIEEPSPLGEQTRAYLERYVYGDGRIWLTTWKTRETNPNLGFEAWLAAHAYQVAHWDFGKPARVLLYERPRTTPATRDVELSGMVALNAAQLESRTVRAGDVVCLHAVWQVKRTGGAALVAFTHLLDDRGRVRAQVDSAPAEGFRPSNSWRAGEIIDDYVALRLDAGIEPGTYEVITGMYQWPSLERLTIAESADNAIRLGAIQVTTHLEGMTPSCYGGQ